jgi:serine/threonine protein kinase
VTASEQSEAVRLLAKLVHRGWLDPQVARSALGQPDPVAALVAEGAFTAEQWADWLATDAGDRPILSRYELRDLLGEGGQARVFEAFDRVDKRIVALKILRPELSRDSAAVQTFVAEARQLIEIEDPHIVRGYRVAREGEVFFCAMERVAGRSLLELLDERQRLDEDLAIEIVRQVAVALAGLQARGLVHRDVKPGNVLWDEAERRAVLIDLGFAAPGRAEAEQAASEEAAGSATTQGTVHYISPEQARGQRDLDVRADIYSLGATLYHLVCGDLPFDGSSGQEVLAKQVLESLSGRRIRELGLSAQLHWLIEKMMAKEKEIRFQNAEELALAIADVQAQQERAAQLHEADPDDSPLRRRRRRPPPGRRRRR